MTKMLDKCALCRGTSRPIYGLARRCRNSAVFRRKAGLPLECAFGVPLNNLRIGDNLPTDARTKARPSRAECLWADRLSCCKVRCKHEVGRGLVFVNAHCREGACRYFVAAATHAR